MKNNYCDYSLSTDEEIMFLKGAIKMQEKEFNRKLEKLEAKQSRMNSKMHEYSEIVKALDEKESKKLLSEFHEEVSQMHSLLRKLVTKLCTITQVDWSIKRTYPAKHYEIMRNLIACLDYDEEWWKVIENKTIKQITDLLMET